MRHLHNPKRPVRVWEVLRKELRSLAEMRPAAARPDDNIEFNTLLEDLFLCETAFEEYSTTHRMDLDRKERQKAGTALFRCFNF
jgi:hypothetical protein